MQEIKQSAFTLIELSVVLVIIGLIIGGVMVGRDLIEASKIRAQITQISDIETQMNTFRVKYNCLPGDCINAAEFFGASFGPNAINNGNGDNIIHSIWGNSAASAVDECINPDTGGEVSQLLLQLNAAGLGKYFANGLLAPSPMAVVGSEYTFAAYGNGTGFFVSCLASTVHPTWIPVFMRAGNIALIGVGATGGRIGYAIGAYGKYAYSAYGYRAPATPIEPIGIPADVSRQIDDKIDDGKPSKGKFGIISGDTACTDNVASYPSPDVFCRVTAGKRIN